MHDIYETDDIVYIVMEYASGGELFEYIVSNTRLKEREARIFFRQILSAVAYCHRVQHRVPARPSDRCCCFYADPCKGPSPHRAR